MGLKLKSKHARAVLITVLVAVCQITVLAQDPAAKIDELLSTYHKYGQLNGSALVAYKGKVVLKKGYGLANMEWNIANEPDTKFRLGSITKQFTATLILQLVEQGKLKLDGKVSDYLDGYRKDTGQRITIHNLLSHTSGVPNYTAMPGFQNISRNPFQVGDFVTKYASGDLEFEPGSKFNYSNSGYFLLGAIIEKVTGKPYEQVLKENIFDPIDMKNTGYDHFDQVLTKRATGYSRTPQGYQNAPYLDMSIPYAAGSLYSTVEDLYLWDQALMGDKILSAKSKQAMFTPNLSNYGYGFVMTKATLGPAKLVVPVIQHNGGINGFSTVIVRMVDDKGVIILLDNTGQGQYQERMVAGIMGILYGQPYDGPQRSLAEVLMKTIIEKDVASAVKQYRDLKAAKTTDYDLNEAVLNTLGYQLLGMDRKTDAIEIFKLNVEAYPDGWNTYDSLGEAYALNHNKELAIENYKKSLEMNPKSPSAPAALASLTGEQKEVHVDQKIYGSYAGDYQLAPNFVLTISTENGKLLAQASGQEKNELFPTSETEFFLKVVNAQITFVKDEQGKVTQLILHQNGRNMEAKKIRQDQQ
ncbi:MAG TPA: serine hydrolase [Pyrinomonadaceae bacterium]|nr:serine hydrolase [Pyrinomonadaceae bacterium]